MLKYIAPLCEESSKVVHATSTSVALCAVEALCSELQVDSMWKQKVEGYEILDLEESDLEPLLPRKTKVSKPVEEPCQYSLNLSDDDSESGGAPASPVVELCAKGEGRVPGMEGLRGQLGEEDRDTDSWKSQFLLDHTSAMPPPPAPGVVAPNLHAPGTRDVAQGTHTLECWHLQAQIPAYTHTQAAGMGASTGFWCGHPAMPA
ncbi:hypothetical protein BDV93DRAFT_515776 [Ceratobasidium sp. AG-I]|nr:hypothetical protein BDV93DRAFT_515776 [Ceratobasidium sp. AG-I]